MNVNHNYLEVNDGPNDRLYESIFKQVISDKWSKPETQQVIEETKCPAFCLKTKDIQTKQKIFVNFCHSSMMKAPTLDLNEEELRTLLASEEANSFTIPLVLTQINRTLDKSGSEALVLDVIINTDFYRNRVVLSQLYKTFLITVSLETIERDKYNGIIDKNNWILLKNKRYQEISGNTTNNNINNNYNNINDKSCDKRVINDLSAVLNINDINNDSNGSTDGIDYDREVKTNIKSNQNIAYSIEGRNGPKTGSVISQETVTAINDRITWYGLQ